MIDFGLDKLTVKEELLLDLIDEVRQRKADSETYAEILASLVERGLNLDQCRYVFSITFKLSYGKTRAISYWRPEYLGLVDTAIINDDKLNAEIEKALLYMTGQTK